MSANIGSVKARLLVKVAGDPVELGEFDIPLSANVGFGNGLGTIHVDESELRNELATALEGAAKKLRDGR